MHYIIRLIFWFFEKKILFSSNQSFKCLFFFSMQQMIKRIISKKFVNLWSYKEPFLDFCFTKSWQLFRGAWNLLLFCPELLQSFSLSTTHCERVVTKFSRSQQGEGVGRFSFLAPMTFVVARLSWHNEIPWLCCPIHKNSSTLFIHLG